MEHLWLSPMLMRVILHYKDTKADGTFEKYVHILSRDSIRIKEPDYTVDSLRNELERNNP